MLTIVKIVLLAVIACLLITIHGLYLKQKYKQTSDKNRNMLSWHKPDNNLSNAITHNIQTMSYPDATQLRIIVLTMNRKESLERLLKSLHISEYGHDIVNIDIWIDVAQNNSTVDLDVLELCNKLIWKHGSKAIHVHNQNAGLREQWLKTWNMSLNGNLTETTNEIALILEDDIEISPVFWHWLKIAHKKYGHSTDVAGFALQRDPATLAFPQRQLVPIGSAFMYNFVGSWGFSPTARHWTRFSTWASEFIRNEANVKPYVPGTVFTSWYKQFEKKGRCPGKNCMWTILHAKYCSLHHDRYSVYVNLPYRQALSINHREIGIHYTKEMKTYNSNKDILCRNKTAWIFEDKLLRFDIRGQYESLNASNYRKK